MNGSALLFGGAEPLCMMKLHRICPLIRQESDVFSTFAVVESPPLRHLSRSAQRLSKSRLKRAEAESPQLLSSETAFQRADVFRNCLNRAVRGCPGQVLGMAQSVPFVITAAETDT